LTQKDYIFTSESVGAGHPDKVADQISDAIVDVALRNGNETTRVACETLVTTNHVTIAGEIKNSAILTNDFVEAIVKDKIKEIGYEQDGFHWNKVNIVNLLHSQSDDIALGTDDFGAGDQGIMFGYACNDTESFMPAPIHYAHELLKDLENKRKLFPDILGPDCKSQVSIQYTNGKPDYATAIVISTQHSQGNITEAKRHALNTIETVMGDMFSIKRTKVHFNPTGNFVIGGPDGDCGLTGRKIIVDTYGGYAPHGGGAFSGKDPSKVDRSAAYMARWLAKNVVASGKANWCNVQLSYAIGIKDPMSVYVDTDRNKYEILDWINTHDLTPYGIIKKFDLFNFYNYSKECVYGHFGNKDVPWEKI
jgi:S-adenosylmethionine synthetase